jgi:ABC-type Fe3+/spermidine/putrescine transport system ATPase subunit
MSRVSIRRLIKRYGETAAVNGIDLEIAEGELVVLLGPSGCGKTTTLRAVAGLEDVDDGEIQIDGEVVSSSRISVPPEKRAIGMVFQSYAIWPHLSVFDNVAFGLRLKRLPKAEIERRVLQVLELVGLSAMSVRGVGQLSGGQQQRVALARAVVLEPRLLLFDEPLSNLDAKLREHMRFELRQLQQRLGITSIYVTHDQQEAMAIADCIVLLRQGKIEQMGAPREIYERPASLFAAEFVGAANVVPATVLAANTILLANGMSLTTNPMPNTVFHQPVTLALRPEHIVLTRQRPRDGNVLPVRIEAAAFLGNIEDLTLDAGGLRLRAQVSPPCRWRAGEQAFAVIAPDDIVTFYAEDNRLHE